MPLLTLWIYRAGRSLVICPRPAGFPPPHDDAQKAGENLTVEEYQAIIEQAAAELAKEYHVPIKSIRPSLPVLAELAADLRWTKKERNTELRHWGYDLDGDDGRKFRTLFDRAVYERSIGGVIADAKDVAPISGPVILWMPDAGEYQKAIDAGLIDAGISRVDYLNRMDQAQRQIRLAGMTCEKTKATVDEILEVMKKHKMPNTTEGRTFAFTTIWVEKQKK